MIIFALYRSISNKAIALLHGELGFTRGKYESVADIENPAEILANIAAVLEPYAFSDEEVPAEVFEELIEALSDFQEAFDVELQEEINELTALCD
ncbi:MAG: hypothetical protein HUJ66_02325 [Oscillospiraceae bacterium]|nr:hypothetical protein [Oscillospiraceae bacterium]